MRRTCEGILVVHDHGHPHILMLQIANAFFKLCVLRCAHVLASAVADSACCCRPGDYLKPGEDEIEGLKARLDDRLAPPAGSMQFNASHGIDNDWEIGDCLAQWWRPNFETFMVRETQHPASSYILNTLRVCAVPIRARAYYEAQGVQEAFPRPAPRT